MKNFSKPYGALPNAFVTVNDLDIHNDVSILKKRSDLNINKFFAFFFFDLYLSFHFDFVKLYNS